MQGMRIASPAAFSHKLPSSAASIASAQVANADTLRTQSRHPPARLASVQCQAQRGGRAQAIAAPANVESESSLKVSISNRDKENWTAIKIEAENQPGLLTKITSTLRDLNLQVQKAEVNTVGNKLVADTFYVVTASGKKLSNAEIAVAKQRLLGLPTAVFQDKAIRPVGVELGGEDKDEAARMELIHRLKDLYLRNDVVAVQESIINHVEYTIGRSRYKFESFEAYHAVAHSVRDRLIESWNDTEQHFQKVNPKRVYYLSMEFLMGRSLLNSLYNLDVKNLYGEALRQLGYDLETLKEEERDAALGNGGLGRLAACFLDSMATLNYPAWGYGMRYQYGMFRQTLENGFQHEQPDYWLNFSNPWEIERVSTKYDIKFYGHVEQYTDSQGRGRFTWVPGERVEAVAYDNPIPGYGTGNTINLRLWAGKPSAEFDLQSFNTGDYVAAILAKQRAETISSVLYPDDRTYQGKELRLKQQHFMVSATLQDIVRRFKEHETDLEKLPEKVTLQLNDTHPTIGVAELMRILMDDEGLGWTKSWAIVTSVFAFTNHTVLPEALEKWPVSLMERLLPRHMQIIYQINFLYLEDLKKRVGDDWSRISRMSIIEEGDPKQVRMAYLALVASHTVNGVAAIHSDLIKTTIFKDFHGIWPEKFQNKTNGVTQRRWLAFCNPGLRALISEVVGSEAWITDLTQLKQLEKHADDAGLQERWMAVKHDNKKRLAALVKKLTGATVSTDALFDIQVKRIHEYKRQLLNMLSVIHRYERIKKMSPEERQHVVPRVVIVGGKAAPGYDMAKRIIKLVSAIGDVVNGDPDVGDLLKVFFLPDYNVSLAETIIPASDLSQHISTAGTEASGTSNMKFAMNGGLIIGTLDGANVEIAEEIGHDNMFIFGVEAHEVPHLREQRREYRPDPRFNKVVELLRQGRFGWTDIFAPICEAIDGQYGGDYYLLANDFASYLDAQDRVDAAFKDKQRWARMSILSTAGSGKFSSDRTIADYARDIWRIEPVKIPVHRPGVN
ncbi:glycogen phosphorylase [Klebsormidium nitens]|uniref:Alpha-1,4 glucan phosphorylase n=1 Tax=Klebsormidium nitens TaxID=105231 RepID=A0A1Y1HVJ4_KLENI|nr:glycogen phosphorylase [Klebsormidium nitens]|eukprot:GAQ82635.1 glycogen phosphorylase [Klebsormidium nitens]